MSDLHDLIRACKAEPEDDAPRLILADWLEENGETERAAFIRHQVLRPEVAEVEHSHIHRWAEPWERLGDEIRASRASGAGLYSLEFQRGFLRVRDGYQELYDRLNRILHPPFGWTWVDEIKFGTWHDGDWSPLFKSDRLLELNRLEFSDDGYRSILLEPLLASRFVTSLRHLRLHDVKIGDDGLARLSACENLASLRSFELVEMYLGPMAARSFAASELWDRLRSCRIVGSRFGDEGLAALAQGRPRPHLEKLDLTIGDYSDQGLVELAKSHCFPALRELAVGCRTVLEHGGLIGGAGVNALLTSPTLAQARIVATIMSEQPVPGELGELYTAHSTRLEVRYRNPRQTSEFKRWVPGDMADTSNQQT